MLSQQWVTRRRPQPLPPQVMIPLFKPHGEESPPRHKSQGKTGGKTSQDSMTETPDKPSSRPSTHKQQSLPQALFKRQCAVDQASGGRSSNPAIVFSANNSVDSTTSPVASGIPDRTAQRLRQERFGKSSGTHSSVNSSIRSNGDVRSFLNRSRKSSLFDLRESALRKFSIIPQVSQCFSRSSTPPSCQNIGWSPLLAFFRRLDSCLQFKSGGKRPGISSR